jgi:hypothetical protein
VPPHGTDTLLRSLANKSLTIMKNTIDCPMCAGRFGDRTELRVHLLCDHRKSAIVAALIGDEGAEDAGDGRSAAGAEVGPVPVPEP